jgi:hypothetical protein
MQSGHYEHGVGSGGSSAPSNSESNLDKQTMQFLNQTQTFGLNPPSVFGHRHSPPSHLPSLKPSRSEFDPFSSPGGLPNPSSHLNFYAPQQYPMMPQMQPQSQLYMPPKLDSLENGNNTNGNASPPLSEMVKRPRRVAKLACVHCRRAHACCDDFRPCSRCLAHGLECKKVEGKKRGRKKKEEEADTLQAGDAAKPKKKKAKKANTPQQQQNERSDTTNMSAEPQHHNLQQKLQNSQPKQTASAPCGPLVASSILANNIFSYHSPELQQLTNLLLNAQDTFYFNNQNGSGNDQGIMNQARNQTPVSLHTPSFGDLNDLALLESEGIEPITNRSTSSAMEDDILASIQSPTFFQNNETKNNPSSSLSPNPHLKLGNNVQRILEESLAILNDSNGDDGEQLPTSSNNRKAYLDYLKNFPSTCIIQTKEEESTRESQSASHTHVYQNKEEEISALKREVEALKHEQQRRTNEVAVMTAINETLRSRFSDMSKNKSTPMLFSPTTKYDEEQIGCYEELVNLMQNKQEMDAAKFGVLVTFPGGRIVTMNQTLLNKLHYKANDLHDQLQRWEDVVHPSFYQTVISNFSRLVKMPPATRKSFKCKVGCRSKDGGPPIEAVLCCTMVGSTVNLTAVFCISFFLFPSLGNDAQNSGDSPPAINNNK